MHNVTHVHAAYVYCLRILPAQSGCAFCLLSPVGHILQVMGIAISNRHPYMFSCGLDKQVKNWDLEQNKVIR